MSNKELEILKVINGIKESCIFITGFTDASHNMCTSTDRAIENIIEESKYLQVLYSDLFEQEEK